MQRVCATPFARLVARRAASATRIHRRAHAGQCMTTIMVQLTRSPIAGLQEENMNRNRADPDGYRWNDVEREHRVAQNCLAHGNVAGYRAHERHAAHMHRDHEIDEAAMRSLLGDERGAQAHLRAARWDQGYENRLRAPPPPAYQYRAEADECGCVIL